MASIERAGAARRAADQAGAPGPGGPSPDTARRLWFKRYPAAQTAARSQTLSTPVTWLTNSEGVNAPSCSASVPLSYV